MKKRLPRWGKALFFGMKTFSWEILSIAETLRINPPIDPEVS